MINRTKTRNASLWHRIMQDIASIARCKSQQNILTAKIEFKTSN